MPTWVWMVRNNRDEALQFLWDAERRGDVEAAAYGRIWLAERQATLDRVEAVYGERL